MNFCAPASMCLPFGMHHPEARADQLGPVLAIPTSLLIPFRLEITQENRPYSRDTLTSTHNSNRCSLETEVAARGGVDSPFSHVSVSTPRAEPIYIQLHFRVQYSNKQVRANTSFVKNIAICKSIDACTICQSLNPSISNPAIRCITHSS